MLHRIENFSSAVEVTRWEREETPSGTWRIDHQVSAEESSFLAAFKGAEGSGSVAYSVSDTDVRIELSADDGDLLFTVTPSSDSKAEVRLTSGSQTLVGTFSSSARTLEGISEADVEGFKFPDYSMFARRIDEFNEDLGQFHRVVPMSGGASAVQRCYERYWRETDTTGESILVPGLLLVGLALGGAPLFFGALVSSAGWALSQKKDVEAARRRLWRCIKEAMKKE